MVLVFADGRYTERIKAGGHVLIIELLEHVVHIVLQRINRVVRICARDEIDLFENLERIDPRQHEHQKRRRRNQRQRNAESAGHKSRALQRRILIQRLRNGLQRRQKDDEAEAQIFPEEHQHDRQAQRAA